MAKKQARPHRVRGCDPPEDAGLNMNGNVIGVEEQTKKERTKKRGPPSWRIGSAPSDRTRARTTWVLDGFREECDEPITEQGVRNGEDSKKKKEK